MIDRLLGDGLKGRVIPRLLSKLRIQALFTILKTKSICYIKAELVFQPNPTYSNIVQIGGRVVRQYVNRLIC